MEPVAGQVLAEQAITILKQTMPFQVAADGLLRKIAALGRRTSYDARAVIYEAGNKADDIYIIVSGQVEHALEPGAQARRPVKLLRQGDVFGWAALLEKYPHRLAKAVSQETTDILRINGEDLLRVLESDPDAGDVIMSRFATMITRDYTVPDLIAQLRRIHRRMHAGDIQGMDLTLYRFRQWIRSPRPYLMLTGFALFLSVWYLSVEVWKLPRFREMPGLTTVIKEWANPNPVYGLSIYTPEYYKHIWVSIRRVAEAFALATLLGVPFGLFLGWSKKFKEYVFPVFELLRPIPVLAWVPLAIVMFIATESAVIYLTFLAAFFATALNTMLGVQSIEESYVRAAYCLGAGRWQVFRHVIVPGALPFIFTGLQISMGVSWFSLVAAEMVSGQYGLGYVINTSYTTVRYPTIFIGMITLGIVGYTTSALVRVIGDYLMQWRTRELALGGQ
ncbi:MAG TPA: ABC transporter permease subunit [Burkholderiales bacterium]|nr:ABC transporter permease subunit [Burkholderiales bacterium]